MLQDLLNGYFTAEAISSASVQIMVVAIITQYIKNFLRASKVDDKWFPLVGIAVGIVTQLIFFFGMYEITRVNLLLALFHGVLYGSLGLASFDIAKAIKQVTVPKKADKEDETEPNKEADKEESTKEIKKVIIEDKNSRNEEQQEFENWAHH